MIGITKDNKLKKLLVVGDKVLIKPKNPNEKTTINNEIKELEKIKSDLIILQQKKKEIEKRRGNCSLCFFSFFFLFCFSFFGFGCFFLIILYFFWIGIVWVIDVIFFPFSDKTVVWNSQSAGDTRFFSSEDACKIQNIWNIIFFRKKSYRNIFII